MRKNTTLWYLRLFTISLMIMVLVACSSSAEETTEHENHALEHDDDHELENDEVEALFLPDLSKIEFDGEKVRVVATTSIIGDVVVQVGGDAIALTTLMGAGQDPHGYEPAARDLTMVAEAHVVFVNGWDLEEGLVDDLENITGDVPVVPISAEIHPLPLDEDDDHDHGDADPHVWLSVSNVKQWVKNVETVLSALDPLNAESYANNAQSYLAELAELEVYAETQLSDIMTRSIVTNHDALSYFARDYHLDILGTVISSDSTVAEPSANELANLVTLMAEHSLCTIFTETSVNNALAETVSAELDHCDNVQLLQLYSGALGPAGSGADSYIGMFRANVDAIVAGLK